MHIVILQIETTILCIYGCVCYGYIHASLRCSILEGVCGNYMHAVYIHEV